MYTEATSVVFGTPQSCNQLVWWCRTQEFGWVWPAVSQWKAAIVQYLYFVMEYMVYTVFSTEFSGLATAKPFREVARLRRLSVCLSRHQPAHSTVIPVKFRPQNYRATWLLDSRLCSAIVDSSVSIDFLTDLLCLHCLLDRIAWLHDLTSSHVIAII